MSLPKYSILTLEFLKSIGDNESHNMTVILECLSRFFKLTDEEKNLKKLSGRETLFHNRVHWAKFNLKKAKFLVDSDKGYVKITNLGLSILKQNLDKIDSKLLKEYFNK